MIVVATYIRVSTLGQAENGYSLEDQQQRVVAFIERQGWILPDHLRFRDGGVSGASLTAPGLNRMLDAARERQFQYLVVPSVDRFARNMVKALNLEAELASCGVEIIDETTPVDRSPTGRFSRNVRYAVAELEKDTIVFRTTRGRRQKALNGKVVGQGSAPPFGYRYTFEELRSGHRRKDGLAPDPLTAPVAQEILDALLTQGTPQIVRNLNARGVPSPTPGRPWNTTTIRSIGLNPVYEGRWIFGRRSKDPDGERIEVPVPALVPLGQTAQIEKALKRRSIVRNGRTLDDRFLLRGMLTCGHCGGILRTAKNNGRRYYACGRAVKAEADRTGQAICPLSSVPAGELEDYLATIIERNLFDIDTIQKIFKNTSSVRQNNDKRRETRRATLDRQLAKHRHSLDQLAARLGEAGTGPFLEAIIRQAKEHETAIAALDDERADLLAEPQDGLPESYADALLSLIMDLRTHLAFSNGRRLMYQRLGIAGTITKGGIGDVKLARAHRFRMDWVATIPLSIPSNQSVAWLERYV